MHKVLTFIIVILAIVALVVLGVSFYGQYQLLESAEINHSQRFALLPGIAVSAGVLIAALTFLRERGKTEMERRRHVSEVLLAQATAGFQTVIELLSDQNNVRVVWIRAARTLLQATKLGREIDSKEYRVAYELQEERTRNELYKLLTIPDPKSKERQPLPPQFFYGIEHWRSCETLDDAAIRASQKLTAYSVTIDAVPPQPYLRPLAAASVIAVFNFIKYPKNYDDPLDEVSDWNENWDQSHDIDQGARRYIAHQKQKTAVDGKLHENRTRTNGPV